MDMGIKRLSLKTSLWTKQLKGETYRKNIKSIKPSLKSFENGNVIPNQEVLDEFFFVLLNPSVHEKNELSF